MTITQRSLSRRRLPTRSKPSAFPPHVTLVHPRTSGRGGDFRDGEWSGREDQEFVAQEVAVTAFDGHKWVVLRTFRLRGESERRS